MSEKKTSVNKLRAGIVLILGRPNVGKSTFLNNIIGKKVSITSPKSQTTRNVIKAVYENDQGQLLFIDTPGIFKKAQDKLSKKINKRALEAIKKEFDVVLYMIDHTRHRDFEEGRVLGLVRKIHKPIILVINKIDIKTPSYLAEYRFLEDEIDEVFLVSSLKRKHIKPLIQSIFSKVKRKYPLIETKDQPFPGLKMHSQEFIEELIREKIYIFTRQEVPYKTRAEVEVIKHRKNKALYIKATIYVLDKRYKKMLIGKQGRMVKEIGMATRKELELSRGQKVFLDLKIGIDYDLINKS